MNQLRLMQIWGKKPLRRFIGGIAEYAFVTKEGRMFILLLCQFLMPSSSFGSDSLQTFHSACQLQAQASYCQSLEKSMFKNSLPLQEFSPRDFMALDYPTDAGTLFLKIYSPRHTAALAYCYFASRGALDQKKVSPPAFATHVNGFMILSSEIPDYEKWLKSIDGVGCRKNVENSVGIALIDLKDLLKNKLGLVALNPSGIVKAEADINYMTKMMMVTLNHERIHLLQSNCPVINDFAKESWARLDPGKKAELKKDIPFYNWDDQKIAIREFLAYTYENNPTPLLEKAKGCIF